MADRQKLIDPLKDPLTDVIIFKGGYRHRGRHVLGLKSHSRLLDLLRSGSKSAPRNQGERNYHSRRYGSNVWKGKWVQLIDMNMTQQKIPDCYFLPCNPCLSDFERDPNLEGINMVAMDEVHKESKGQ